MDEPDFLDFIMEGGADLLNNKLCPHCGDVIYIDQKIEWIDKEKKIAKCPSCAGEVEVVG